MGQGDSVGLVRNGILYPVLSILTTVWSEPMESQTRQRCRRQDPTGDGSKCNFPGGGAVGKGALQSLSVSTSTSVFKSGLLVWGLLLLLLLLLVVRRSLVCRFPMKRCHFVLSLWYCLLNGLLCPAFFIIPGLC